MNQVADERAWDTLIKDAVYHTAKALSSECTVATLGDEAFEEALWHMKGHWAYERIRELDILVPEEGGSQQVIADVMERLTRQMRGRQEEIMLKARAEMLAWSNRVVIRVYRHRIEIVDLVSSSQDYPPDDNLSFRD